MEYNNYKRVILALLFGVLGLPSFGQESNPFASYFKEKQVKSAESEFVSLYQQENKVYLGVPKKLLGKELLMGGTISSVSDAAYLMVGMKTPELMHFRFELASSGKMLLLKKPNHLLLPNPKATAIEGALALNYTDPTITGLEIEAYNTDSTQVLVEVTSLMARPNDKLPLIPKTSGKYTLVATPKPSMSFVKSIQAYPTTASVRTEFNYDLTVNVLGVLPVLSGFPTTVEATFSIIQLPEERMRPRVADARVGYSTMNKYAFVSDNKKVKTVPIANRWRLEPQSPQLIADGELTLPQQKITFYLDTLFPADWKAPIREGVLRWNSAFEQIGFKDVIEVLDFPSTDSLFNADNIAFSTIRYIPNYSEQIQAPFWADPISGEILSASLFIPNNIEQDFYRNRFVQTAAADPRMQASQMPRALFYETLSYFVTREVGHILGLLDNVGASAVYSTEELRSASFTQQNGLATSVMDLAHYNYVAQPKDKGVLFLPNQLGPYDYYAIAWGYRYFPQATTTLKEESEQLESWVDAQTQNPIYRYKPVQNFGFVIDPTAVVHDLGSDPIKASEYGMKNLSTVLHNLSNWITNDEDSKKKAKLDLLIAQQYHRYVKHVMHLVGGVEVNVAKEGSTVPRYKVVPKAKQREALKWAIHQTQHFAEHANRDLERRGFLSVSYYDQLLEFLSMDLFRLRARVIVAEHIAPQGAYTQQEFFHDLFTEIFKPTLQGRHLNSNQMYLQRSFVENGNAYLTGAAPKEGPAMPLAITSPVQSFTIPAQGYLSAPQSGIYPQVPTGLLDRGGIYYYDALIKLKPILQKALRTAPTPQDKAHYQAMLFRVEKALDKQK